MGKQASKIITDIQNANLSERDLERLHKIILVEMQKKGVRVAINQSGFKAELVPAQSAQLPLEKEPSQETKDMLANIASEHGVTEGYYELWKVGGLIHLGVMEGTEAVFDTSVELPIDEEPSLRDKQLLAERAASEGLTAGHYSLWQIGHVMTSVFNLMSAMTFHEMQDEITRMTYINGIERKLADIRGYVSRKHKDEPLVKEGQSNPRVYPFSHEDVEELTGLIGGFQTIHETIQTNRDPNNIPIEDVPSLIVSGDINEHIELANQAMDKVEIEAQKLISDVMSVSTGLKALLSNQDRGEKLRRAVATLPGNYGDVSDWITAFKKQGAPEKPAIEILCERVHDWKENQKMNWPTIFETMESMFEDENSDLSELEQKQIDEWWDSDNGLMGNLQSNYYRWRRKNRH